MIIKGQKINDRYQIIRLIGEGGMANVYLAQDTILDRKVAVKILRGDLADDEKFVRRFQREAISASSLNHPNIVEMYDVGEDDGKYFIVTKNMFLYLGIIGCEGRGVKLYLDTFQNKDIDSHLVFIGYGEYAEEVEKISKNYQNIHYHEAVPHDKVVEISNSADIGLCMIEHVSLSDYYCLPNKFFEYAFSGLYILATDFPDMKLILDRYDLGECCKYDEKEFQKAVKSIESRKIIKEQRNLNLLSWEHQAEQLNKKYYKLINIENNPCVEQ